GDCARRGLPAVAVPAHDARQHFRQERKAAGSLLARDRGLRAADRLGLLDRAEPFGLSRRARPAGGPDRRARPARLLRRPQAGESAGVRLADSLAAVAVSNPWRAPLAARFSEQLVRFWRVRLLKRGEFLGGGRDLLFGFGGSGYWRGAAEASA